MVKNGFRVRKQFMKSFSQTKLLLLFNYKRFHSNLCLNRDKLILRLSSVFQLRWVENVCTKKAKGEAQVVQKRGKMAPLYTKPFKLPDSSLPESFSVDVSSSE